LYAIESGRVYWQGETILFFNGRRVFRGANATGRILFTVENGRIFAGENAAGSLAYTVANGRVYKGDKIGPVIYTIQGERVFRGANTTGKIVLQANRELAGNVQFLLPILADLFLQPQSFPP